MSSRKHNSSTGGGEEKEERETENKEAVSSLPQINETLVFYQRHARNLFSVERIRLIMAFKAASLGISRQSIYLPSLDI